MVLVINKSKKDASALADILHYMGVLALGVTPTEALSEISLLYRTVIIMEPHTLPDKRDFVNRLRRYASSIPIFAVSYSGVIEGSEIFDSTVNSKYSSEFVAKIADFQKSRDLPFIGDYRLNGLNATSDLGSVFYFDTPIKYTKTEAMILRLLMRSYPSPCSAARILKYAFRHSGKPEPSSVRTHISLMNKKFREIEGRNLIAFIPNDGYTVLTPEVIEKNKVKIFDENLL